MNGTSVIRESTQLHTEVYYDRLNDITKLYKKITRRLIGLSNSIIARSQPYHHSLTQLATPAVHQYRAQHTL